MQCNAMPCASLQQCLIEQGEKMGLVVRKGAWYSYKDMLK